MGLHHLLLGRTTSNFSLVLFQAVEDLVVLWFVLCHHPSKLVSSLVLFQAVEDLVVLWFVLC